MRLTFLILFLYALLFGVCLGQEPRLGMWSDPYGCVPAGARDIPTTWTQGELMWVHGPTLDALSTRTATVNDYGDSVAFFGGLDAGPYLFGLRVGDLGTTPTEATSLFQATVRDPLEFMIQGYDATRPRTVEIANDALMSAMQTNNVPLNQAGLVRDVIRQTARNLYRVELRRRADSIGIAQ